jgi:hypothetical protein
MTTINKNITIGLNAYNASARISAANWENSLIEPVMVEEGDAIYVKSSFIDARLHTSANILIEQDTTIEIENMFYYINRGGTPVKSLYNKNIHPFDPYQAATLTSQVGVGEFGTVPDQSPNDADFAPITGYPPGYDPAWAPLPPDDPNAKPPVNWKSGLPLNITDEKNILNMAPIVETIVCPEFDGQDDYLNPCKGTGRLPVNCGDGMPYLLYRSFPSRDQSATANGVLTLNNPNMTNAVATGLAPLTTITWNTNEAGPVTFLNLQYTLPSATGTPVANLAIGDYVVPVNLGEQGQTEPCFNWGLINSQCQPATSALLRIGQTYQITDNNLQGTLVNSTTGFVSANQTVFTAVDRGSGSQTNFIVIDTQPDLVWTCVDSVAGISYPVSAFSTPFKVVFDRDPAVSPNVLKLNPFLTDLFLATGQFLGNSLAITILCPSAFRTNITYQFVATSGDLEGNEISLMSNVTSNFYPGDAINLITFNPDGAFTLTGTYPSTAQATSATASFTIPTGTRVYIPGTDFPGGNSPENDVYITYNGPPYTTVGPPASDWTFSGQPPFSSGTVTSNETMTNNVIEPFVKLFKYTIPRGSYSPDTLGVMITRAMSQQKPRVLRDMTLGGPTALSNTADVGGILVPVVVPTSFTITPANLGNTTIVVVASNPIDNAVPPTRTFTPPDFNQNYSITIQESTTGLVEYNAAVSIFECALNQPQFLTLSKYQTITCTITNPPGFPPWVIILTGTLDNNDFAWDAYGTIRNFDQSAQLWIPPAPANPQLPPIKINCLTVPCQLPSSMLYGDQRSTWNSGFGATDTNNYTAGKPPTAPITITPAYPAGTPALTFTPTLNDWIFNPAMNKPLYDIVSQQCGWNSLIDGNSYNPTGGSGQYPFADVGNGLNVFQKQFYDGYSAVPTNLNDFGSGDMTYQVEPSSWGGPPAPTSDACMYQDYSFASKNKFTQPIGKGQNPPGPTDKQPLSPDYNGDVYKDFDDTPFLIRPTAFQTVQQRYVTNIITPAATVVAPDIIVQQEFPPVPDAEVGDSLYIRRGAANFPECPSFQSQNTTLGAAAVINVPVYRLCVNYAHNEAANRMEDIQYNPPQVPTRRPATVEVMYKPFLTDIQSNYFQSQFLISDKKMINDYFIKPILSTQAIPLNTDLGDAGNEVNGPTDISSPVVGAQEISLVWNPNDNVFQFTYTHTPLYNKPDLSSAELNEVVGVYPCNVFVNNNQNNLISPAQQGTNIIYPAPYFRTVKGSFQATRQSGVIFKSMKAFNPDGSPSDFWSKLGFNVDALTASPPEDNPSAPFLSYNRFQEITTGGFFGTGSVLNPETKACGLQEIPYLTLQDSFNMAGWWTRDVMFTPYNAFGGPAKQYQQTFTLVSNPLYYEVQSTNYLTATNVPLDTQEAGHYLLEIQGYSTTHIDETQKSEIKSIVSSYYISANSFVSNAFPENFKYYHYGPSMKIACLKIRILNPITKQEVPLLGNNSTVYLSIDKASPTIQKGMKEQEIEGLPFNWFS